MKRITLILYAIATFVLYVIVTAQINAEHKSVRATAAAHSVTLTWTASVDSSSSMSYSVYRGTSSGGEGSTAIATGVATGCSGAACTYVDSAVSGGTQYWYYLRAVVGSASSANSNEATATTGIAPPTGLSGTGN